MIQVVSSVLLHWEAQSEGILVLKLKNYITYSKGEAIHLVEAKEHCNTTVEHMYYSHHKDEDV